MRAVDRVMVWAGTLALFGQPLLGQTSLAADAALDPAPAVRAIAERRHACDRDAKRMWGVDLCGPIIFVDPQTRAVVADRDSASLHAVARDRVFLGALPASVLIANTSFSLDGRQWSMVKLPLPNDPVERAILVAHESWHRVQDGLGLPASSPSNDHLDTADGRYWLELEWRALARAVIAYGPARRAAVADALDFRAERLRRFPGAATTENALLLNEGLAEDTGVAFVTAGADRAVRVVEELASGRQRPSFVRSFAYAAGPAYGALLDAARPGWRRLLSARSDLAAMLAGAYGIHAAATRARTRVAAYDDGSLRDAEDVRAAILAAQIARYRAAFVTGPVLRIEMRGSRFSFDPNRVTPLGDAGTVYAPFAATGWFGTLEAPDGALMSRDFSSIAVSAPPDAGTTKTPAWTFTPADGCALVASGRLGDFTVVCGNGK